MGKKMDHFIGFTATFNEAFTLIGLVYLGVKKARDLAEKLSKDRSDLLFWSLLALSGAVSIIFSPYKTTAIACFFIPFVFIYLYILGRYTISDPVIFFRSLIRGAAVLSLIAVVAKVFQLEWSIGSFRILADFSSDGRGEILYVANNLLGLMAQVGVIGAAGSLLDYWQEKKYRVENIITFLVCSGALLVSGSRGAIIGSLAGLFFLAVHYGVVIILVTAGILLGFLFLIAMVRRGGDILLLFHDPVRMVIWRGALRIILERPLFGWGPGVFTEIFEKYRPVGFTTNVTCAHSDYLNIFTGWGLIGGTLFWGWQLFVLIRAWMRGFSPLQRISVAILLSFYVHVALNDLFAAYAGLLLGLLQHPVFLQAPGNIHPSTATAGVFSNE